MAKLYIGNQDNVAKGIELGGSDPNAIKKDGTTTTTGKIPLAKGGTSEVDPAAATDLVNLRSMQAADQALESSMTEYVDNQLEAAVADVHSIPAGGTAGQVLSKVDGTDYNTHRIDPTGKMVFVETINENFGIYKDENRYYIVATQFMGVPDVPASELSAQSIFSNGKKYSYTIYDGAISTEYIPGSTQEQLIAFRFASDSQIGFLTSYRNGESFTIESNWISSSQYGNGFAIYPGQIVFTGRLDV